MSTKNSTSQAPTFEGRPLARPNDDIEDQGLAFDLRTLENRQARTGRLNAVSRRGFLSLFGLSVGSATLTACGINSSSSSTASSSTSTSATSTAATDELAEMPTETNGPYPADGTNGPDVLEQVGVERKDIRSSIGGGETANGVPATLRMNIVDMANNNRPMTGAAVYVWHCDATGRYSMYSEGLENETYLRGVQTVNDEGYVEFTTIVPGCYEGRYPHIHFEVFPEIDSISDASNNVLVSQIVVPDAVTEPTYATDNYASSVTPKSHMTLDKDNVFGDGADLQTPTVTGGVKSGFEMTITVGVDTTTEQTGGTMAGPGGDSGPGGGNGGPGGQPPAGNPPGGTPPTGNPPSGNPPSGNPPNGNTANGNPASGNASSAGSQTSTSAGSQAA
ncbi:3,4-dioxygenase subunit beta [Corynebacterium anserum]|uniref:3,4-dioxygenase subunit beta n=1 Tax=Corynebacterium anserum TaxID=2684406 RepID=A0A7G7YLP4_9CORY|nr:3,4-dioxygenase subunit beta [Corynebacterium anserum]MBC2681426.1 3,4-dioxygenase subunit beta [Corynebacterium anserum]QNH95414.1 3,4-dioxygenase subunit beta [Corynebacterium anserum]